MTNLCLGAGGQHFKTAMKQDALNSSTLHLKLSFEMA
jgi:hypothetical protein